MPTAPQANSGPDTFLAGWTGPERAAWRPPERIRPSVWAERHRFLTQSARPGPWRDTNAPYLRGMVDVAVARGVYQIVVKKAAQIGVSEAFRNLFAYWAVEDPEPFGVALPDKEKGRKIIGNRYIPMFTDTPVLRALKPKRAWDFNKGEMRLAHGMLVHLMWSGSASSTSSDPMCRAVCDEVDKFQAWTGRESDPVSLIAKRLRTYEDRARLIAISTPTTRDGKVSRLFENCGFQLFYHVPCPRCGSLIRLNWPQVKWRVPDELSSKAERADYVLDTPSAVWYECQDCGGRIDERERQHAVLHGIWRGSGIDDAEAVERWPRRSRIGFQISALYCRWMSLSEVAAEWFLAKGDLGATMDFRNETLGEEFEQQTRRATTSQFESLRTAAKLPEGIIPEWAIRLVATVDTQKDYFIVVIRAWGLNMESARVFHGRIDSFDGLERICLGRAFKFENNVYPAMAPDLVLIDSGGTADEDGGESRTMQVYRWAIERQTKVKCTKGPSKRRVGGYLWMGTGFLRMAGGRRGTGQEIPLWYVDGHHFNDELADQIRGGRWHLNTRPDPIYETQMANVHRVGIRRGHKIEQEWLPISIGARIDYRDCEVLQVAGAYMSGVHTATAKDRPFSAMTAGGGWFANQTTRKD